MVSCSTTSYHAGAAARACSNGLQRCNGSCSAATGPAALQRVLQRCNGSHSPDLDAREELAAAGQLQHEVHAALVGDLSRDVGACHCRPL